MSKNLNRMFRVMWNDALGAWVAVAEFAKARGKRSGAGRGAVAAAVLSVILGGWTAGAMAAPDMASFQQQRSILGEQGKVKKETGANGLTNTTVQQSVDRAVVYWNQFDVKAGESVKFEHVQGSSNFAVLNKVLGNKASQIDGSVTSKGRVFLVNTNGINFGKGSKVDVGSLVASSLTINESEFLSDQYRFGRPDYQAEGGAVKNQGELIARSGSVVLMGNTVENSKTIRAENGTASLIAGDEVRLAFSSEGRHTVSLVPAKGSNARAEVTNTGNIVAPDVKLMARTWNGERAAVNHSGLIEANLPTAKDGDQVYMLRPGGINLSGQIRSAKDVVFDGKTKITQGAEVAANNNIVFKGDVSMDTRAAAGLYADKTIDFQGKLEGNHGLLQIGTMNADGKLRNICLGTTCPESASAYTLRSNVLEKAGAESNVGGKGLSQLKVDAGKGWVQIADAQVYTRTKLSTASSLWLGSNVGSKVYAPNMIVEYGGELNQADGTGVRVDVLRKTARPFSF